MVPWHMGRESDVRSHKSIAQAHSKSRKVVRCLCQRSRNHCENAMPSKLRDVSWEHFVEWKPIGYSTSLPPRKGRAAGLAGAVQLRHSLSMIESYQVRWILVWSIQAAYDRERRDPSSIRLPRCAVQTRLSRACLRIIDGVSHLDQTATDRSLMVGTDEVAAERTQTVAKWK